MRSSTPRRALLAWLLCVPCVVVPVHAQPDTARIGLRFRWPVGMQGRITNRRVKSETQGAKRDTTVQQWIVRVAVERDSGGRLIALSLDEDDDTAERAPVSARPDLAFAKTLPGLVVDTSGALLHLVRFEDVAASLQRRLRGRLDSLSALSPAGAALVQRMLGLEHLQELLEVEWARVVGVWRGADLELGREYSLEFPGQGTALLPDARIPTAAYFGIKSLTPCVEKAGSAGCVHLVWVERPHLDSAPAVVDALLRQLVPSAAGPLKTERLAIERRTDLITEPSTLIPHQMIYREHATGAVRDNKGSLAEFESDNTSWYQFEWALEPSALRRAATTGDERAVRQLLKQGTPADEEDLEGESPLYAAALQGHGTIVRLLAADGANSNHAYALARARGQLGAMRLLAPHASGARTLRVSLDSAVRLFDRSDVAAATPAFADLALAEAHPGDAQAWLARALLVVDVDRSRTLASAVLASEPCNAIAHSVLSAAFDPTFGPPATVSIDSAWLHALEAVRCAPSNGTYALRVARLAARRGDSAAEDRALQRVEELRLFTSAGLARARWTLDVLPRNAILIVESTSNGYAMRVVQRQGQRSDVMVVDLAVLGARAGARQTLSRLGGPLPLPGAVVDSLGSSVRRGSAPLAAAIFKAWRTQYAAQSFERPLAIAMEVNTDSIDGPGHLRTFGLFDLLAAEGDTTPADPRVVWSIFKGASAEMHGAPTDTSDHDPWRRSDDVLNSALFASWRYLSAMRVEPFMFDASQLAALDSLVEWAERTLVSADWMHRDDMLRSLGRTRAELSNATLALPDFAASKRHARRASELDPMRPGSWNNLGYQSLLAGEFSTADSALRRSFALWPSTPAYLNLATVARLTGQLDSALTWLRRAAAFATRERLEQQGESGAWTVNYLPVRPGDRETIRRTTSVRTPAEKQSLIYYNVSIVHAMRGNFDLADGELANAQALAGDQRLLCYAANLMEATRGFTKVSAASKKWLLAAESRLRKEGCSRLRQRS